MSELLSIIQNKGQSKGNYVLLPGRLSFSFRLFQKLLICLPLTFDKLEKRGLQQSHKA